MSGTDPNGDTIVGFNLITGPSEGNLVINSDGSFSFADDGSFDDLGLG